jgi:hypothetical protein
MEPVPTWLGVTCLAIIVAVVVFAFRQGQKVKGPAQGVPPEVTPPPPNV